MTNRSGPRDSRLMFDMGYDRQHNVLLVRLFGTFTPQTMQRMDTACATFLNAEGPGHSIFDFSRVEASDMSADRVERRAERAQLCPGFERIVVAPQPAIFAMADMFRIHQTSQGLAAPQVVRTMEEAEAALGLGPLAFRPVDTSWLDAPTVV
jgi:hypothetical protein